MKMENEQRKVEVHGLKDILVRENDLRIRDTEELRMAMELSSQKLGEALERECFEMDQVRTVRSPGVDFMHWFAPYSSLRPIFTPQNSFSKVVHRHRMQMYRTVSIICAIHPNFMKQTPVNARLKRTPKIYALL